jgi:hypothetical protein
MIKEEVWERGGGDGKEMVWICTVKEREWERVGMVKEWWDDKRRGSERG